MRKQTKVSGTSETMQISESNNLARTREKAIAALKDTDLDCIYEAKAMDRNNKSVDTALKVILAEKLVDSIHMAKRYARKARFKKVNASAVFIAAQENRW